MKPVIVKDHRDLTAAEIAKACEVEALGPPEKKVLGPATSRMVGVVSKKKRKPKPGVSPWLVLLGLYAASRVLGRRGRK